MLLYEGSLQAPCSGTAGGASDSWVADGGSSFTEGEMVAIGEGVPGDLKSRKTLTLMIHNPWSTLTTYVCTYNIGLELSSLCSIIGYKITN